FVGVDVNTNGSPRTATYRFTPPGGSWDGTDNGIYTVTQVANQVLDTTGRAAPPATLGTFRVVLPAAFVVTNANDSGPGSLRGGLARANGWPSLDTFTFDPVFFGTPRTINFISQLPLSDSVTVVGPGADRLPLSGGNQNRLFRSFTSGAAIT